MDKKSVRKQMRAWRNALPQAFRVEAAGALSQQLRQDGLLIKGRKVAMYWAGDGEIDPFMCAAQLLACGGRLFLPHIVRKRRAELRFKRFKPGMWMRSNRYFIPEPAHGPLWSAAQMDVILLPLVAFTRHGQRLGMGGGFYDSTLACRMQHKQYDRPVIAGLAFEGQRCDTLAVDPWDVPLDCVYTERRCYRP